ncbi:uncharacterized protein [Euwallacea fornicatus]|uniref:uncharacterized protein n=1 Tax=Euwallacea fornicatus TaxID=995702 RepID=UPI00338E88BC
MGGGLSHNRSQRNSFRSHANGSIINTVSSKIDDKDNVFISMQGDIQVSMNSNDKAQMRNLISEITAHLVDLDQIRLVKNIPNMDLGRYRKVRHNFEIALATLKSTLELAPSSTEIKSQNPDLVSDLINFGVSSCSSDSITNNNHLEDLLRSIDGELGVLKDNLGRSDGHSDIFCNIDKGAFYLQAKLNGLEISNESPLNKWKFRLLQDLSDFRKVVARQIRSLEEREQLIKVINLLEVKLEGATTKEDFERLHSKARELQEILQKFPWEHEVGVSKDQLMKKLVMVENATSASQIYGNLSYQAQEELKSINSIDKVLQEYSGSYENHEIYGRTTLRETNLYDNYEAFQQKLSDCVDDEEIYGNMETIRQEQQSPRISQRGTVYVNEEVIKQHSHGSMDNQEKLSNVSKRPLPLPRNFENNLIASLPKNWERLNQILESEQLSDMQKEEVVDIRKQAEIAKNLFERKIRKIIEKYEDTMEM